MLVAVVVVGWLTLDRVWGHGGGHAIAWQDASAEIRSARFTGPITRVIETHGELREVIGGDAPIDLAGSRAVLIAAGPRSSTGYALDVVGVEEQRRRVVVSVRERAPALGDRVRPGVTYPFRLLLLPRSDKRVEVER